MNQNKNLSGAARGPAVPALRRLLRLIACLAGLAVSCAPGHAQIGHTPPLMAGPPDVTCTNMELMKQVPCPDSTLFFREGQALVQQAYYAKNFQEMDELYERWCTGKDRFPDGRWKLSQYGVGLEVSFEAWNAWNKDLETIRSWQKARPHSTAALYAEAVYWRAYAWKARGGGYAGTVSAEGWELFRERLAKARQALTTLHERGARCAAPYALTLGVLTDLGAPEQMLTAVFDEAVREHREYHNIYFAMARHYEPRWGGSVEQYERFASEVAEQTRSFEGMGLYARLYWLVDSRRNMPFTNEPGRAPYWGKLKAGYEDLMRLYPSSMHNLGKYAGVACRSDESELYRKLRSHIAGYEHGAEMLDPVDVCDRRHKWAPASR